MNLPTTQGELSVKTDINLASKPDNKRGYLIDMDGVIYRGNKLIPGSDYFIFKPYWTKKSPFYF